MAPRSSNRSETFKNEFLGPETPINYRNPFKPQKNYITTIMWHVFQTTFFEIIRIFIGNSLWTHVVPQQGMWQPNLLLSLINEPSFQENLLNKSVIALKKDTEKSSFDSRRLREVPSLGPLTPTTRLHLDWNWSSWVRKGLNLLYSPKNPVNISQITAQLSVLLSCQKITTGFSLIFTYFSVIECASYNNAIELFLLLLVPLQGPTRRIR